MFTLLDLCASSMRRGNANLLCIVPILTGDPRRESKAQQDLRHPAREERVYRREGPPTILYYIMLHQHIHIYIYIYMFYDTTYHDILYHIALLSISLYVYGYIQIHT